METKRAESRKNRTNNERHLEWKQRKTMRRKEEKREKQRTTPPKNMKNG